MRGLFNCFIISLVVVGLFSSFATARRKHTRAATIQLSLHPGTNVYWLAVAVNDPSITEVDIKDSGSISWTSLTSTNWGYWVFTPSGESLTFPVSVTITSPRGVLIFDNIFSVGDAGTTYDTHASFAAAVPTVAPTPAPTGSGTSSTPTSAATSSATSGSGTSSTSAVEITQTTINSWPGGSQYTVYITNHGTTALTAVSVSVQSGNIVNLWGVEQIDGTYVLPTYITENGGVLPGASFNFGYITDNSSPVSFVVGSATFASSTPSAPVTAAPKEPATQPPATTQAPTQAPVTTQAPTTTKKPTNPSTQAPTTAVPTNAPTDAPTKAPATEAPSTAAPTTEAPTKTPTTTAPTKTPTTAAPTTEPSAHTPVTITGNPFTGATMYSPPYYSAQVQATVNANPSAAATLSKLLNAPVSFWIDSISKISSLPGVLAGARGQQATSGTPSIVSIVVYDLPNRDCAALASNGEIPCADATCAAGIAQYKASYLDAIITILKQYEDVRVAAIVEPDSLPNLVTNLGVPKCTTAQIAYKTCVAYAIQQLATLPNVAIYVDAAHGGWLGWTSNLAGMATIFSEVLTLAGGANKIRGFTTNVANYQPLGSLTSIDDPCALVSQYNFAINEVAYTNLLSAALTTAGIPSKTFIIDTSRNGVVRARSNCQNWCNINKAGLGARPTASPTGLGVSNIDALLWVKPPGESDGTSDSSAPRYDAHCSSPDSVTPAPEAGTWFPTYFLMTAQNAVPAL